MKDKDTTNYTNANANANANANGRSAVDKERTKMRERQRRSITTNIFHGLRKHGGYRLSPRADINEVLRHLAQEAGWTVHPDGTTYRSASSSAGGISCPLCGVGRRSAAATPSCSFLGGGGGGGDCSTTASPPRPAESAVNSLSSTEDDGLLGIYMNGAEPHNGGGVLPAVFGEGTQQQQMYLVHESRVSNENTPAGSP